jgi:hypothetical protein
MVARSRMERGRVTSGAGLSKLFRGFLPAGSRQALDA